MHHDALRDLQLQVVGSQSGLLEGFANLLDQVGLLKLAGGDVDVERKRRVAPVLFLPRAHLTASFLQHPLSDGRYEPRLFRQRYELARGMRPYKGCCQRTNASTPVIVPVSSETSGW